jgi:bifunctional non-homologous end joining protein LigD
VKANSQRMPSFIEPMQTLAAEELPEGDWLYEINHDGYRPSRSRKAKMCGWPRETTSRLLLDSLKLFAIEQAILDGEIVALDDKGWSSFQLVQDCKSSEQRVPLVYYAFDLLFVDGKDLRQEPLSARRKFLVQVLKNAPENIRLSDELRGSKERAPPGYTRVWTRGTGRQKTKFRLRKRARDAPGSNTRSPSLRSS